ncbi:hypothetical protein EB73_09625 [Mycobacterium sp. SWH-M3]|nr:hypothetical protein EB73_09625 [Mycobacterium sp. SWH-M3]
MNKTTYAAATLLTLTALSGASILVQQGVTGAQENGQSVTFPRTVVMAAPPEPCPYPLARCAPIPPRPLDAMTDEERQAAASEYTAAWDEVTGR